MKNFNNNLFFCTFLMTISLMIYGQGGYVHNEIIVNFESSSVYQVSAESAGCTLIKKFEGINAELWCVDTLKLDGQSILGVNNIVNFYNNYFDGSYAEPNYVFETYGDEPNDPLYDDLWGMEKIDALTAWKIESGSEDVVVAVIDSGLDWAHPDLAENIWQNLGEDADGDGQVLEWTGVQWIFDPDDDNGIDDDGNGFVDDFVGWDFVDNDNTPNDYDCGHGTHVAGTIGARGNNKIGVIGVCPNVKLMAVKVLQYNPFRERCAGNVDVIIDGIDYAVKMGAKISNNSYGGEISDDLELKSLKDQIKVAEMNDHLFVTASGNYGNDIDSNPAYPAAYDLPNIISVAATNRLDLLSSFEFGGSNYGVVSVDLSAPGSNIWSTEPGGGYKIDNGTSMASPHVAGTAALIASHCEDYSYEAIKGLIMSSVNVVPGLEGKCITQGRLNAGNALSSIEDNCTEPPSCLDSDYLALVSLYEATSGLNWDIYNEPVNMWDGVTVNEDGCVTELNLGTNGLTGYIPAQIGDLANLTILNLKNNDLKGSIPAQIGNLVNLTFLDLSSNNLTGTIPVQLAELENLEELLLYRNELSGNIPKEFANLSDLTILSLRNNELDGNIPKELSNLSNLTKLILFNNKLYGSIPSELSILSNLEQLELQNNVLTGDIPKELSRLEDLITLNISNNVLTGEIPRELGELSSIEKIYISDNDLTGGIPTQLSNLSNLKELNLRHNSLSGNLPVAFENLENLEELILDFNELSGSLPSEYGDLNKLISLVLSENDFIGTIPSSFGDISTLYELNLDGNEITGEIPSKLGLLSKLNELNLRHNGLTGSIPPELGQLSNLRRLFLNDNELNDVIPNELGNLFSLQDLDLSDNQLCGCYPASLCDLDICNPVSQSCQYLSPFANNYRLPDGGSLEGFEMFCFGTPPSCNSEELCSQVEGADCPELGLNFGDFCDDGSDATIGDFVRGNCKCLGYQPGHCLTKDSLALIAFYNSTSGSTWTIKWDVTKPVETWHGVELSEDGCNVICLDFDGNSDCDLSNSFGNNLGGKLPPEIGNFEKLTNIYLANNNISGSIPAEIGNLTDLAYLDLGYNDLSGIIPVELGNLSNLTYLRIRANHLNGYIPEDLSNLSQLSYLDISDNQFTGSIPLKLGLLSNLNVLNLQNNQLTGEIPGELGDLLSLDTLAISYNKLRGKIPDELSELSNLTSLILSDNFITGAIPEELGELQNLRRVWLSDNQLEGCYPFDWCPNFNSEDDFDCSGNMGLPDGGSFSGFLNFCEEPDSCVYYECDSLILDLGPDQYIGCGKTAILRTQLPDMKITIWQYEGQNISYEDTVVAEVPGTYTAILTDSCDVIVVDSVEVENLDDCVWPGDANCDRQVNSLDVLTWGLDVSKMGPSRENGSAFWYGQVGEDWENTDSNDINDKHSDTNGDGIIDLYDLDAIRDNYKETHGGESPSLSLLNLENSISFQTDLAQTSIAGGQVVLAITFNDYSESIYGLAWEIDFGDISLEKAEKVQFIYNGDWFGEENVEAKDFSYFDLESKKMDIAITRINAQDVVGSGIIGHLIIEDENLGSWGDFSINITDAMLMDGDGDLFRLNSDGFTPTSIFNFDFGVDKVKLEAGWNLISLNVLPYDKTIKSVFGNLKEHNLEYVMSFNNGAMMYNANDIEMYNTLDSVNLDYGYWVKVKEEDELVIEGQYPKKSFDENLNMGWNLVSFLSDYSYRPEIFFANLIYTNNLILVTGYNGEELFFEPLNENSTLNTMENGSAYWVKVKNAIGSGVEDRINATNVFDFVYGTSNLSKGDEIQIQDEDANVIGLIKVLMEGNIEASPIYGDDEMTTDFVEGFKKGDAVYFVYNNTKIDAGIIFSGKKLVEKVDLIFENVNNNELNVNAYPNPVTDLMSFDLDLVEFDKGVTINIYDQMGRLVYAFKEDDLTQNRNFLELDLSRLFVGRYTYVVGNGKNRKMASFVKIK